MFNLNSVLGCCLAIQRSRSAQRADSCILLDVCLDELQFGQQAVFDLCSSGSPMRPDMVMQMVDRLCRYKHAQAYADRASKCPFFLYCWISVQLVLPSYILSLQSVSHMLQLSWMSGYSRSWVAKLSSVVNEVSFSVISWIFQEFHVQPRYVILFWGGSS